MSRFSPQVLPTYTSPFAAALDAGFGSFMSERERKRQQKAAETLAAQQTQGAEDRHIAAQANLYGMGYRLPSDVSAVPTDLGGSPDFTPPSSDMLARGLRAGPSAATPIDQTIPTGDELATALRGNLPATAADPASLALRTSPTAVQPTQQAAPVKPGLWGMAFDPTTGTFGGAAPPPAGIMIAKAVQQRLSNGLVLDPNQTPDAIRARQQGAQAAEQDRLRVQRETDAEVAKQRRAFTSLKSKGALPPDAVFDEKNLSDYVTDLTHYYDVEKAKTAASGRGTQPRIEELIRDRIKVLTDGGMKLDKANAQARLEFGQTLPTTAEQRDSYTTYQDTDPDTGKPRTMLLNTRTGKAEAIGGGKAGSSGNAGGKISDAARLTAAFVQRMTKASETIDKLESSPALFEALSDPIGSPSGTGRIPYIGNATLDETMQDYQQAQREWVRAKLRKESGAAIGKDEMQQEIETYFPQPRDSESVKKQKAASRKEAESAMRTAAGPAIPSASAPPKDSGDIDLSKQPITSAEYDELRKTFSDADIRAKYTVTP